MRPRFLPLQKFARGGVFNTIDAENRNKGPLGHSPLCEDVWNALLRANVVQKHAISGVGKDRGLGIAREHQHEVRQFTDNALLSGAVAQAVAAVAKDYGIVSNSAINM